MLRDAVRVGSAALIARIVTTAGNGRNCGAVKSAAFVVMPAMVPTVEFPPGTFCTLQVTAVFAAFDTVAVSATDVPSKADELADVSATEMFEAASAADEEFADGDPAAPHPDTPKNAIAIAKYPAASAGRFQVAVLTFLVLQDMRCPEARAMPRRVSPCVKTQMKILRGPNVIKLGRLAAIFLASGALGSR